MTLIKLTGTKSPRTECTILGLLWCSTEDSSLGLSLTEGSGTGTESACACGGSAFKVSVKRARSKREIRTESSGGGLLTERRVTEETAGLLLRLCRTETAGTEASRLLWLGLTKRTEPSPGRLLLLWLLLLLLAKRTKTCPSGSTSRPKSTSAATTEGRLSGLRCRLSLAKQAPRYRGLCRRTERAGAESSRSSCLTVLLIILQPEFLRGTKSM